MPYRVPTFPLQCNIYTPNVVGDFPPLAGAVLRASNLFCALIAGRRSFIATGLRTAAGGTPTYGICLAIAKGTDIRGPQDTTNKRDIVQCPAASNRWYWVAAVDDVAKGFANEYRQAVLVPITGSWPAPYP